MGPRLVRASRPRRQRQPQLHAGRRRDAGDAGLPARVRQRRRDGARPEHHLAEQHRRRYSRRATVSGTAPNQNMWRWQSIQEFQYPHDEYLAPYRNQPLFIGVEIGRRRVTSTRRCRSSPARCPRRSTGATLPTTPGYTALGNANALAQWEYCFDRGDTDTSRGNTTVGTVPVPAATTGIARSRAARTRSTPSWNATGAEADSGRRHGHRAQGPPEDRRRR